MNQQDFELVVKATMESIHKLLAVKGGEYAGSADRLANFKRGASRVGLTPKQVLWIYAAKHIDSIETYVRNDASGKDYVLSEPIEGRLDDLINYCLLLKALVAEERMPVNSMEDYKQEYLQKEQERIRRDGYFPQTFGPAQA